MTDKPHYNPFGKAYAEKNNEVVGKKYSEKNELSNFDTVAENKDFQSEGYNSFGRRSSEKNKKKDYTNKGFDGDSQVSSNHSAFEKIFILS